MENKNTNEGNTIVCKKCNKESESNDGEICYNCASNEEDNEILVKAYIGNNADQIYDDMYVNSKFVWWCILFGPFYFAYRKMYLITFLSLLAIGVIPAIIPIGAPLFIIWPLVASPLYKLDIDRKIKEIREENPNQSTEDLANIAREKGGTSVLAGILFCVGLIMLITIIFLWL